MFKLPKEIEEGNIEYKRDLLNVDEERKKHLASQMKWRVSEGNGEAIYYIGINDNGSFYGLNYNEINISIKILKEITNIINVKINNINKNKINNKYYAIINIKNISNKKYFNIGFIGSSKAGKSTLINILSHNITDNGKGSARLSIFNHKHEIISGMTSSIGIKILGYKNNICINEKCIFNNDIINSSNKIINLIDFPGHLKYYKTIFNKLLSFNLNYLLIVINPFNINYQLIKFYINYCLITKKYFSIIFTNNEKKSFNITTILNFFKKLKINLNEYDNNIKINKYYYISISNINRNNIDLLKKLINNISNINLKDNNKDEIQIIHKYNNEFLGMIYSGICLNNNFNVNDDIFIESNGEWHKSKLLSLQVNQLNSSTVYKNCLLGLKLDINIDKPTIIVKNINNYNFYNKINLKILYTYYKKINIKEVNKSSYNIIPKSNIDIMLFICNKIIIGKIIDINNLTIILKENILIKNNILFKIGNNYGIGLIYIKK